jgi:hypothetical protein
VKTFPPKPKHCVICETLFSPRAAFATCCSQRCAVKKVKADKAAAKVALKARKAAQETPRALLPKAQKQINRWCRFRDLLAGCGCISCGATYRSAFGGAFDAGHFRSVGSASHLRFYTPQIRLQCVRCNRNLGGNAIEFRKGLVAERGAEWVEQIESMYWIANWTVDYLRRLTQVAKKRADRLEKRLEKQQA